MAFDYQQLFRNMINAASGQLKAAGPQAQAYLQQVMQNHKTILLQLAQARIENQINDADLKSQVEQEEEALSAELLGLDVMAKEAAQNAANAAISVLNDAINAAL